VKTGRENTVNFQKFFHHPHVGAQAPALNRQMAPVRRGHRPRGKVPGLGIESVEGKSFKFLISQPRQRSLCYSAEIAQQHDVTAGLATAKQQLSSVRGPVEVEDLTRIEFGYSLRRSTCEGLFPEVGYPILDLL
jgi:hypothetical protein